MLDDVMYDENWASIYDKYTQLRGRIDEVDEAVNFLYHYSSGGNALELGVGGGRVAVPLSERGVCVEGIDNSDSMLEILAKRSDRVRTWKADIANFKSAQHYNLVYCVYNTFQLLFTREAQLACLRSAAEALDDEGTLVIEIAVPGLNGFVGGQRTSTVLLDQENAILFAEVHQPLKQNVLSTLLWFSGTSVRRLPHHIRYVYHEELDTMAEYVGLKLAERWENWARGAFSGNSRRHISVYRLQR
ncbi:class I SAM-dependent methyltransferase [Mesorhizobium sp.]|uniref:class I SAM-dependent methyltransferase n=1 Tax=Mesorhizobium sp. TaxID=1871066 RepID=UPI0011FBAD17|nr:class I SAM-dependent methyltransferase [Mesorhizobium sp.]TIP39117.1 MAG: methyltransferase domain-containing protein [Mesorhizobium sp.]